MNYLPLLGSTGVAVADGYVAIASHAGATKQAAHVGFEVAMVATGLVAPRLGVDRHLATGAGVAGAALLGRNLPRLLTGKIKL